MTRNLPTITNLKFHKLLVTCGRRCQHESWDSKTLKNVRCEMEHHGQQQDGRKGPVNLTAVMTHKGIRLYCQMHALEVLTKTNSDWAHRSL